MDIYDTMFLVASIVAFCLYLVVIKFAFSGDSGALLSVCAVFLLMSYYANYSGISSLMSRSENVFVFFAIPIVASGCFGSVSKGSVKASNNKYSPSDISKLLSAPDNAYLAKAIDITYQRNKLSKKNSHRKPWNCNMSDEEYKEYINDKIRSLDWDAIIQLQNQCSEMLKRIETKNK